MKLYYKLAVLGMCMIIHTGCASAEKKTRAAIADEVTKEMEKHKHHFDDAMTYCSPDQFNLAWERIKGEIGAWIRK